MIKKGKIEYIDKNKQDKKTQIIELNDANEKELSEVLQKVEKLINLEIPPTATLQTKCKKCAYYEYCFI